jgi:Ca-activated chloride channel homolog
LDPIEANKKMIQLKVSLAIALVSLPFLNLSAIARTVPPQDRSPDASCIAKYGGDRETGQSPRSTGRSNNRVRLNIKGGFSGSQPLQRLPQSQPGVMPSVMPNVLTPSPINQPTPQGSTKPKARSASEPLADSMRFPDKPFSTEGYSALDENPFLAPTRTPLSTFSIDVDTASYSNVRRLIQDQQQPPKDAVRIEEMINYFPYDYAAPKADRPFSVTTSVIQTPWQPQHKLVQIGLKGKQLETLPPSNLVFLVDVSGSMNGPNRLPLVKQSLCLLTEQLTAQDKVSIVVYAGNAGLVLSPTSGAEKSKIMAAIDALEAGGSTAGGQGIELAYKQAQTSFLKNGNNRVILATDGDFNVGVSSDGELVRLIEQKRDKGIFLTVLGFGRGNYKDNKMEQLADKGNGNYAYIDTFLEAKKVLVHDIRGTLFTIAKDVKIQVEFNPQQVQAYRLIGYENRALKDRDFNDDTKDAGEIGSGHTVTALYEIVPAGIKSDIKPGSIDDLKYQKVDPGSGVSSTDELLQVKLRYKLPGDDRSQLISQVVANQLVASNPEQKFATSVALFGMILRDSEHKGKGTIDDVIQLAQQGQGRDPMGYRGDFLRVVKAYQQLKRS